jgi:hypothetical protein
MNILYLSTLYDKPSDMLHCGCIILPRELGEVWHLEPWTERYLIIASWIRCPVHVGLLLGLYPKLLLQCL